MGMDGPGLFSDDTACDVRDTYREAVASGVDDEQARAAVLEEFAEALDDVDEAPIVWLALAHTQSKLGRLDPETRRAALAMLDAGADLSRWAELGARAVRERAAALDRVRQQIEGPQPARRPIRRPTRAVSKLVAGQVLGYRARSGRLHLMRVVAMIDEDEFHAPLIRFLDYADEPIPTAEQLADIPDRQPHPVRWRLAEQLVIERSRERREDHGINIIGAPPARPDDAPRPWDSSSGWKFVASYLDSRDRDMDSADY
ncbi:hypothetical protein [Rugosimonospora africana]|uniref:hypothetical protein n=1 Tax=Rugosimonospora africana TaxID=556532 RepID=UPI00194167F8|nr:hypothetical protein [Rugosimonospora africana]